MYNNNYIIIVVMYFVQGDVALHGIDWDDPIAVDEVDYVASTKCSTPLDKRDSCSDTIFCKLWN